MKYVLQVALFVGLLTGTATQIVAQSNRLTITPPSPPRLLEHMQATQSVPHYRPEQITHLTMLDAGWINETRNRNLYSGGLLQRRYVEIWEGDAIGEWHEFSLIEYDYTDGYLTETTSYEQSLDGWIGDTRIRYTLENGIYAQILTQEFVGGAWVNYERDSYTLANNQISGGLSEFWNGTAWAPSERFTLLEDGADVVETYQVYTGSTWINATRTFYPNQTIASLYVFLQQLIYDSTDYEGLYFALRLPDTVTQEWTGTWTNVSRQVTERFYDVWSSELVEDVIISSDWIEGAWVPGVQINVKYATSNSVPAELVGLPTQSRYLLFDGTGWFELLVEKYILRNDIRRIVQATTEVNYGGGFQEATQVRIDWTDVASSTEDDELPAHIALDQNYPNPFNPSTQIRFTLSELQPIRLSVIDLLGREVAVLREGYEAAGTHVASWEASHMPSGMYLYRLEAGSQSITRQMVLLK